MEYLKKNARGGGITDVDDKQGIITGYFSKFDNKDSDGDVVEKGAFKKSVGERFAKGDIAYLWNHDFGQPIGKLTALYEDDKGLKFEGQLSKSRIGQDKLIEYREGIINQHSFSGYAIKQKATDNANYLKEIMLLEGSAVVLGANNETQVTSIKSFTDYIQSLDKLNQMLSLKTKDFSDDYLNTLESKIKEIEKSIQLYKTVEPQTKNDIDLKELEKLFNLNS